jgi:hypothetical protein
LLLKIDTIMDMIFLQDPKECMAIFVGMETIEFLHNSLVDVFGQWYIYPTISLYLPSMHV